MGTQINYIFIKNKFFYIFFSKWLKFWHQLTKYFKNRKNTSTFWPKVRPNFLHLPILFVIILYYVFVNVWDYCYHFILYVCSCMILLVIIIYYMFIHVWHYWLSFYIIKVAWVLVPTPLVLIPTYPITGYTYPKF